jgi:anti-anti-sigma factor
MVVANTPYVRVELKDNVLLARVLCPNITHLEHQILQAQLSELTAKYGPRLILDLSEVLLIGSSGLSTFIALNKDIAAAKGAFALACMKEDLVQLLKMTHLIKLFKLYPTVPAAFEATK